MVCHGYGGTKVASERASPQIIREVARRISMAKGVIRAEVVHRTIPEHVACQYDIIFEFGHLDEIGYTHEELVADLMKINVEGHGISTPDLFILEEESYRKGKEKT